MYLNFTVLNVFVILENVFHRNRSVADIRTSIYNLYFLQPLVESIPDLPEPPASPDCVRQTEQRAESQQQSMRDLLWTLSKNYLEPTDWKKLARHWGFTEEHIQAIEHQYTGKKKRNVLLCYY